MRAYLYLLRFTTPVHFGAPDSALSLYASEDHFCADTLFSALCHTACVMEGREGAAFLCEEAEQGNLLLSDSMPWMEETENRGTYSLFLPRPMLLSQKAAPHDRAKAMKKRPWIPVRLIDAFLSSVRSETDFDPLKIPLAFGKSGVMERVAVSRSDETDSAPYPVGSYRFCPDCGLYVIALVRSAELENRLHTLMTGLGLSGIGGKTASGYGKFTLAATIDLDSSHDQQGQWLRNAMRNADSPRQLLLTASLPRREEMETSLDGACFQMIRRAGFIQPAGACAHGSKKRTQYFLAAGSVLGRRFSGRIHTVGEGKDHPIVRYGLPMFLGLSQE